MPVPTFRAESLLILSCPIEDPRVIGLDWAIRITEGPGVHTYGFFNDEGVIPTICLLPSRVPIRGIFVSLVLHELGHALGLEHNEDERTIMFRNQDYSSKHITPEDVRTFCALHRCLSKKD